jgi:hypothetical protein
MSGTGNELVQYIYYQHFDCNDSKSIYTARISVSQTDHIVFHIPVFLYSMICSLFYTSGVNICNDWCISSCYILPDLISHNATRPCLPFLGGRGYFTKFTPCLVTYFSCAVCHTKMVDKVWSQHEKKLIMVD